MIDIGERNVAQIRNNHEQGCFNGFLGELLGVQKSFKGGR